jgi:hypothetical protein
MVIDNQDKFILRPIYPRPIALNQPKSDRIRSSHKPLSNSIHRPDIYNLTALDLLTINHLLDLGN